jgi:FKBP-type peptidyl-prolyl cis-trans isomerase (trigger factor)
MVARMKHDIQMMGMQFDDYLVHLKKTEAELRTDYTPDAIKRAKLNFIVEKLALSENLKPSDEETEKEIQKIMEAYPDADRTSATMYITTTLTNQKVFDFLEKSAN